MFQRSRQSSERKEEKKNDNFTGIHTNSALSKLSADDSLTSPLEKACSKRFHNGWTLSRRKRSSGRRRRVSASRSWRFSQSATQGRTRHLRREPLSRPCCFCCSFWDRNRTVFVGIFWRLAKLLPREKRKLDYNLTKFQTIDSLGLSERPVWIKTGLAIERKGKRMKSVPSRNCPRLRLALKKERVFESEMQMFPIVKAFIFQNWLLVRILGSWDMKNYSRERTLKVVHSSPYTLLFFLR